MNWFYVSLVLQILSNIVTGVTDLPLIDRKLTDLYKNPDPSKIQELMDLVHLYLITLRRFNTMTRKGCTETSEEASQLVHSGGPEFFKTHAFYSDEEQVFRRQMNFTDFQFQEYQYLRLDSENEWNELKDQIAHLDRDKEVKAQEMKKSLTGIGITLSE